MILFLHLFLSSIIGQPMFNGLHHYMSLLHIVIIMYINYIYIYKTYYNVYNDNVILLIIMLIVLLRNPF